MLLRHGFVAEDENDAQQAAEELNRFITILALV